MAKGSVAGTTEARREGLNMGTPLDDNGRLRLAHTLVQSMIFNRGIFVGEHKGGDPDNKWQPEIDDLSLLWNLIRTTPSIEAELMNTYGWQWQPLKRQFAIDEERFKGTDWYITVERGKEIRNRDT